MSPANRKTILRIGTAGVVLLAAGALSGGYSMLHGRHWMTKANGSIQFSTWGLASLAGSLFLLLLAWTTAPGFARFAERQPVRACWMRQVANGVMWALALVIAALLIMMPVA